MWLQIHPQCRMHGNCIAVTMRIATPKGPKCGSLHDLHEKAGSNFVTANSYFIAMQFAVQSQEFSPRVWTWSRNVNILGSCPLISPFSFFSESGISPRLNLLPYSVREGYVVSDEDGLVTRRTYRQMLLESPVRITRQDTCSYLADQSKERFLANGLQSGQGCLVGSDLVNLCVVSAKNPSIL